jgi:hypothetical protein
MRREHTYSGMLGDWRRLLESLDSNTSELAHLEVPRAQLTALLTQALATTQQQAVHTAAKQDLSRQLKAQLADGQRLASLLRATVRVHYGIRAEKLTQFGVQPFRGRRKASPAPEAAEPAASLPS